MTPQFNISSGRQFWDINYIHYQKIKMHARFDKLYLDLYFRIYYSPDLIENWYTFVR